MSQEIIDSILSAGIVTRAGSSALATNDVQFDGNVTAKNLNYDDFLMSSNLQVGETDVSATNPVPVHLYGNDSGTKRLAAVNSSGILKVVGATTEGVAISSGTNDNPLIVGGRYETTARSLSDGTMAGLSITKQGYLHITPPKFSQQLLDASTTGNSLSSASATNTSSVDVLAYSRVVFFGNVSNDRTLVVQVSDDNATFYDTDSSVSISPGGEDYYLTCSAAAQYVRLSVTAGGSTVDVDCYVACG